MPWHFKDRYRSYTEPWEPLVYAVWGMFFAPPHDLALTCYCRFFWRVY